MDVRCVTIGKKDKPKGKDKFHDQRRGERLARSHLMTSIGC